MIASSKKGGIPKGHSKTSRSIRLDNNVIKKQKKNQNTIHIKLKVGQHLHHQKAESEHLYIKKKQCILITLSKYFSIKSYT